LNLAAAIPNALDVEHIPQLGSLTRHGIGIDWDHDAINNVRAG